MANMKLNLKLIPYSKSVEISKSIIGTPTENRVVILSPTELEKTTVSGLYVPSAVKEGVPRKGVIVSMGPITDEYVTYKHQLNIGSIVTYGQYAGKELDPNFKEEIQDIDGQFTILSLNEILYVEPNNK